MAAPVTNYLISAVQFDVAERHIVKARLHIDGGASTTRGVEMPRATILLFLERGHSLSTILTGRDGRFKRGSKVMLVEVDGERFMRTAAGAVAADDLGDLPRILTCRRGGFPDGRRGEVAPSALSGCDWRKERHGAVEKFTAETLPCM